MFFDDDQNFARLLAELESWKGTPFVHNSCIKGGGVDCVHFPNQVFVNIGAITSAKFPERYVYRGGGIEMREIMEAAIATVPQFDLVFHAERLPVVPDIRRGDMLMISTGKAMHHLSVVGQPPQLWHCLDKVALGNIADPEVRRRLWAIYRVR